MTVLLVLFFFATFLLIDYVRTRHAIVKPALQVAPARHDAAPRLKPPWLAVSRFRRTFAITGHTWA